ncbi:hypothetical protein BUALT_Bualt11G0051400 [Buddleja alternifolia]|uniref:HhH-GPD domain-containing protein n=1 Tax=Buddleja alternifolia TaxID=168488 RepID=A0AAV6X3G7_9LAMI|nr:hypothetical protein BUALT_Bualt11G0051400 [Buddleja alternifolia]
MVSLQMGEHIETLTNPQSQSQSQTETVNTQLDSNPQSPHKSADSNPQIPPTPPITSVIEAPHAAAATDMSHNTHNPSKIPIRPQKIRKLSNPTPSSTDDKPSSSQTTVSSASLALTTTTTTTAATSSATSATPTVPAASRNRRRSASQASNALPQVMRSLLADGEIEFALAHLRTADPLLSPLIDTHPSPQFEAHLPPFHALTKSILYQQLAYKAGTSIYNRFVALCGGDDSVCPDSVLALSSQQLKQIGVSSRKASYLYDLANKYKSGILSDDMVLKMDDRSLFTMLSMVKGIGSWSVHMFMIFSLYRPDVLPVSDLGVRKGVQLLYGLMELPRPSLMESLCEKWRPYRSVGAWYMWRFVERKENTTTGSAVSLEGNFVQPLQQIEPHHNGQNQQHQLQFVEPVNGIETSGTCSLYY